MGIEYYNEKNYAALKNIWAYSQDRQSASQTGFWFIWRRRRETAKV